jgi:hypothetical protein
MKPCRHREFEIDLIAGEVCKKCGCLRIKKVEKKVEEPVFILRAQDESAPAVIQVWISMNRNAPPEKLASARQLIQDMRNWPKKKKAD